MREPRPPLIVIHSESYGGPVCPECGSDYPKRFVMFGRRRCVNPRCGLSERESHSHRSIRSMLDAPARKVRQDLGLPPLEDKRLDNRVVGPSGDVIELPGFDTVRDVL